MEYFRHPELIERLRPEANRRAESIEADLCEAFLDHTLERPLPVVSTASLTVAQMADVLCRYPQLLKPLIAVCNVARRALEQDLGYANVDTYEPRMSAADCLAIAAYIHPMLPTEISIDAIVRLDRFWYIDKELRAWKGRWEQAIAAALNSLAAGEFKKRMIQVGTQRFELDAASPPEGDVDFGVDVKRIGAPRDIHKRTDEIVNKAAHLKVLHPGARFGSVIYYPFDDKDNIVDRMAGTEVDAVVFAGDDEASIVGAVETLITQLGIPQD